MATISLVCPPCPKCKRRPEIEVEESQFDAYNSGELIQRAFPNLTPDQRELIMTGTHPECWKLMFQPSEKEAGRMQDECGT